MGGGRRGWFKTGPDTSHPVDPRFLRCSATSPPRRRGCFWLFGRSPRGPLAVTRTRQDVVGNRAPSSHD